MAGRWNDRLASWDSALGAGEHGAIKGFQNLGGAMSIPWVAKHTLLIARLVSLQSPESQEPRRNIQQNVSQKVRGQGTWPVQALAVQAGEAAAGFAKVPWTELSGVRKGLSAALACMAVIVPAQDLRSFSSDVEEALGCLASEKGLKATADGKVVEPITKLEFESVICNDSGADCKILLGVGHRSKNILRMKDLKIYAFGLYADPDLIRSHFSSKYKGVAPEDLRKDPEFYKDVLTHECDLTVRLIVHFKGLTMDKVKQAFEGSLKRRLSKITGKEDHEELVTFTSYFNKPMKIKRGTTIDFRWHPGGKLSTRIAGQQVGVIESGVFCKAFFDMYVGDPPVLQSTKEDFGANLARVLSC